MQEKTGDKYFLWLLQIHNYLIRQRNKISIKIAFKSNAFTRQRTLINSEHNQLKRLHQFYHRNQVNLLTLSCIPTICYFKAL